MLHTTLTMIIMPRNTEKTDSVTQDNLMYKVCVKKNYSCQ